MPRQSENLLTDTAIRKAESKAKPYKIFDGKGLFVLVKPNGGKYFRWRYRIDDKEKTLAFGVYPRTTLAEARRQRLEAEQKLADAKRGRGGGMDPSAYRRQQKAEARERRRAAELDTTRTFIKAAEGWMQTQHWVGKHARDVANSLKHHVYPTLGDQPMVSITKTQVRVVLLMVQDAGRVETAHRVHQRLRAIFKWAVDRDWCERNHASELDGILAPVKVTKMQHIPLDEFPDFLRRLAANEAQLHRATWYALHLVIHTFVRTSELRMATWSEFDLGSKLWRIPAHHMKKKDAGDHLVPLSKQVTDLLSELHEITGHGELVFPGDRHPERPMSENTMLFALYRMGYRGRAQVHGFRSLASTLLNESGKWHPDAIERQMSHHEKDKVRAAYNHAQHLADRRRMMQWWSDKLDSLRKGGDVVSFDNARIRKW
jgi:integrase